MTDSNVSKLKVHRATKFKVYFSQQVIFKQECWNGIAYSIYLSKRTTFSKIVPEAVYGPFTPVS